LEEEEAPTLDRDNLGILLAEKREPGGDVKSPTPVDRLGRVVGEREL
jgi:hypothetical protein